jgi:hypothetical protein
MSAGSRRWALLGLAAALWTTGCAAVAPWERGRLAEPHMALEPDPAQRELRDHTYRSREAATSGPLGEGGGCGCY